MKTIHKVIRIFRSRGQRRTLILLLLGVALVGINLTSTLVSAQNTNDQSIILFPATSVPMVAGTSRVVNSSPGNQSDAHIQGNLISYTDDTSAGAKNIRYFDLATNTDQLVPGNGADSESEVNNGQIAFTESTPLGTQIVLFDTITQARTVLDGYGYSKPSFGGNYLMFEDRSSTDFLHASDISGYLLPNNFFFHLTLDQTPDTNPIVSQAGNAMIYQKCQSAGVDCSFQGFLTFLPGPIPPVTFPGAPGASQYDVNNEYVLAYTSNKDGDTDVYIQPMTNQVPETRLVIPGEQRNVSISGNLVSFESPVQLGGVLEYDIFVYDISAAKLYQVTNTSVDETMSDISVQNDFARIVYSTPSQTTNSDVVVFKFAAPGTTPAQINDLNDLVISLNLAGGTGTSLASKLQTALAALEICDLVTACDSLTAFINACQAQSGKKLTTAQANQLIGSATQIKTQLGCP
jgi:hypothetical protein